jgi:hypothetical protein
MHLIAPAEGANSHKRSGPSTAHSIFRQLESGYIDNPPKGQVAPATKTLR